MVRPFGKEAAAAAAGEASFANELFLDFNADLSCLPPRGPASSTAAADLQHDDELLFRDFFGPDVDGLLELPAEGEDKEEEELEWLVNKDAFPGVETSFEVPTSSGGGSGSRESATTTDMTGERPSPISVLAAAGSSVPVKPRSIRRRRQRRILTGLTPAPAAVAAEKEGALTEERRRCWHCQAEETPQWRTGPEGPKTLCNACGVRYKSGRLVPEYRPISSPTFSADIHSNSHRRIMEMRRQKATTGGAAPVSTSSHRRGDNPTASPQPYPNKK